MARSNTNTYDPAVRSVQENLDALDRLDALAKFIFWLSYLGIQTGGEQGFNPSHSVGSVYHVDASAMLRRCILERSQVKTRASICNIYKGIARRTFSLARWFAGQPDDDIIPHLPRYRPGVVDLYLRLLPQAFLNKEETVTRILRADGLIASHTSSSTTTNGEIDGGNLTLREFHHHNLAQNNG